MPARASAGPAFACAKLAFPWGETWPKPGEAVKLTVTLGDVSATLSGVATNWSWPALRRGRLVVGVDGRAVSSASLEMPAGSHLPPRVPRGLVGLTTLAPSFWWQSSPKTTPANEPLCVARFAGPETAVLVGLYTFGAHCCTWLDAYPVLDGRAGPVPVEQDMSNPGASLYQSGPNALVVTADNAFAYRFSSYAGSGMPVRALELRGRQFVNVTREHLGLVAAEVPHWWRNYLGNYSLKTLPPGNGLGILAALVADQCELGKGTEAWATVAKLEAEGKLAGNMAGTSQRGPMYVKALKAFLASRGYCAP